MKMKKMLMIFAAAIMISSAISVPAADQPNMTAARSDLNRAANALRKATADKGGHRNRAVNLINQAIAEVNRGIAFDNATPGDNIRRPRRPRRNSDFEEINFAAADQPNMRDAKNHLQDALDHLQKADNDKGGHRKKAVELVKEAIDEVEKGIRFDRNN